MRRNRILIEVRRPGDEPTITRMAKRMSCHLKINPNPNQDQILPRTVVTSVFLIDMKSSSDRGYYIFHTFIVGSEPFSVSIGLSIFIVLYEHWFRGIPIMPTFSII